jgi:hypothetical protein
MLKTDKKQKIKIYLTKKTQSPCYMGMIDGWFGFLVEYNSCGVVFDAEIMDDGSADPPKLPYVQRKFIPYSQIQLIEYSYDEDRPDPQWIRTNSMV